jgi:GH15 family glucan-1,4-alpha-glucosidase
MTGALEQLGMIGDGQTAALISDRGSIDWLCLPRFDSPACCAALLGTREHGYWSIAPQGAITESRQRYDTDTLILETDLATDEGTIRLTDFMPVREREPLLALSHTALINALLAFERSTALGSSH